MKKILPTFIIALILFGGMYLVGSRAMQVDVALKQAAELSQAINQNVAGMETANAYVTPQTSTGVAVTTSSTQVLATSTGRSYARISNLSGNAIYCNLDTGKPAVAFSGIMVQATSTLVISDNDSSLYRGAVNCIAVGATASTTAYQR